MQTFAFYYADEGCRWHRFLQPARFCHKEMKGRGVALKLVNAVNSVGVDGDTNFLHGLTAPANYATIARWAGTGRRFVWSLDDDMLSVPITNPCKPSPEQLGAWHLTRKIADAVVVSTPALAKTLDRDRVFATPNLNDLSLFPSSLVGEPAPLERGEPLRILWAGSQTHLDDLAVLEPAIDSLLRKYGAGRVEFVFLGYCSPNLLRDHLHRGLYFEQGVPLNSYHATLCNIRPHVVLAPLDPCPFNAAKSNIRILDGWSLSAAVVATRWGEYGAVGHAADGLAVDPNSPEQWADAVSLLIEDDAARRRLAAAGRERVDAEWNWQRAECRRPWIEAFTSIAA